MKYFLLWCKEDESLSLVNGASVVCEESVQAGDKVKFFVRTKEYVGEVKGIGTDYDELKTLQDKLNSQNKPKPASFHEDRKRTIQTPRRFHDSPPGKQPSRSGKNKKIGDNKKPRPAVASSKPTSPKKSFRYSSEQIAANRAEATRRTSVLQRIRAKALLKKDNEAEAAAAEAKRTAEKEEALGHAAKDNDIVSQKSDGGVMSSDMCTSSTEEELSPEEKAAYDKIQRKLACKQAKLDARTLRNLEISKQAPTPTLAEGPTSSKCVSKELPLDSKECPEPVMVTVGGGNGNDVEDMDVNEEGGIMNWGSSDEEDNERKKARQKERTGSQKANNLIPYEGIQFMYEKPGVDQSEFVELKGPKGKATGVFCLKSHMTKARRLGKTATSYARKIMEGVFDESALKECTVSGDVFRAGGKAKQIRKPKLDEKGVDAIIDAALVRQETKKWNPSCDSLTVKNSLRQKLVDRRLVKKTAVSDQKESDVA